LVTCRGERQELETEGSNSCSIVDNPIAGRSLKRRSIMLGSLDHEISALKIRADLRMDFPRAPLSGFWRKKEASQGPRAKLLCSVVDAPLVGCRALRSSSINRKHFVVPKHDEVSLCAQSSVGLGIAPLDPLICINVSSHPVWHLTTPYGHTLLADRDGCSSLTRPARFADRLVGAARDQNILPSEFS
jgi:hypothetical protein